MQLIIPKIWLSLSFVLFGLLLAQAHETGSTFLSIVVEEGRLLGRWEIDLHDFPEVPQTAGPAASSPESQRVDHALKHLSISLDGAAHEIESGSAQWRLERADQGTNLVVRFELPLARAPERLELEYDLFFEQEPRHRGLLQLDCDGVTQTAIFRPDQRSQHFDLRRPRPLQQFFQFTLEGVWHIWIGFDHVLFLMALLLPAVFRREQNQWAPVLRFGPALWQVVKIVTAFTLAHSLTLSVAALGLIELPSQWVEAAIAASVAAAALNNLRPLVAERTWSIAFLFGLVHGFGFANVLMELGLPKNALLWALFGFNAGVELGQLAIVALLFPAAYLLRETSFYRKGLFYAGSMLIALVAAAWFIERVFELDWLPF